MAKAQRGTRAISDEAVRSKTGRGWDEWFAVLDEWDVPAVGHTATAKRLREELGVDPWWAQAVTVRYEHERGLR